MRIVLHLNLFHKLVEYLLLEFCRHQVKSQCKQVCGGRIIAVLKGFRIEEFPVNGYFHFFCQIIEIFGIIRLVKHLSIAMHQPEVVVKECRSDIFARCQPCRIFGMDHLGINGRHTPVAIIIPGHQIIFQVGIYHMVDPSLQWVVTIPYCIFIGILVVQHFYHLNGGSGPGNIVIIKGPVGRIHIGETPAFLLGIKDICEPLLIEVFDIIEIGFSP